MKQNRLSKEEVNSKIIPMTWKNPDFQKRLLTNPAAGFKEAGFDLSEVSEIIEDLEVWVSCLPSSPVFSKSLKEDEAVQMLKCEPPDTWISCGKCK